MINSGPAGEYYRRMRKDIYLLRPEILTWHRFYMNEFLEVNLDFVLLCQLVVRGFF